MTKVAVFIGTRPEVIKMAPIIQELRRRSSFDCSVISTGQHETMSNQAMKIFDLIPDIDLAVMQTAQDLPNLTSRLIVAVSETLKAVRPDIVLVQGDTTTVLSASISAFYQRIPVGHVEAGLRTYDYTAPWPEEMNRRVTDAVCQWCFAPTKLSKENLIREGIDSKRVYITGNTVIDALLWVRNQMKKNRPALPNGVENYVKGHRMMLVTAHRRESFGEPLERICRAILEIVNSFSDLKVVFPVHLNPNVKRPVEQLLGKHERIFLMDPVCYEAFVWLMSTAYIVLTDSGGIQEEAPSLGKPVLVLRNTTERPEGVVAGTVQLVGTETARIVHECTTLLSDPVVYDTRARIVNPYGDGMASIRIADALEGFSSV